jgi:protocatechuate 3,4-dioxygenase alpha subunit
MSLIPSASQTVGPFFNFALTPDARLGAMAAEGAEGDRISLAFRVVDGDGAPTPGDSMIELWQADAQGRYTEGRDPHFRGFGRLETSPNGECIFETVKPGSVEGQAPHINVMVFARGLLKQLYTRVYFEGEAANAHDPVLALVPEDRRSTLLARPAAGRPNAWSIVIRLQGAAETVFFDV